MGKQVVITDELTQINELIWSWKEIALKLRYLIRL